MIEPYEEVADGTPDVAFLGRPPTPARSESSLHDVYF